VVRAVSASGVVIEGMDYGAFGERRGYTDPTLAALVPRTTPRGFTGHEMIDGTDIVHMNGRIYDSALGRFLQADPIIQEPNNPQNFNRYSYVLNNPLSLTDPSGFLFGGIGKAFRRALAGVLRNIPIPSENPFIRLLGTVALNLLANLIEPQAGGSSGVRGAFSNVAVSGFGQGPGIGSAGGTAGSDGGFGHDFVQAGFFVGIANGVATGDDVAAVTQNVLVAGTDSEQTGGKFVNGAASDDGASPFLLPAYQVPLTRADRAEIAIGRSASDVFVGFTRAQIQFIEAYLQGALEDGPGAALAGPVGPALRLRSLAGARLARLGIPAEEAVALELGLARNIGPGRVTVPGSGPGGFRVPDFDPAETLRRFGVLVEVKGGSSPLGLTPQLRDLKEFADANNGILVIKTNRPLRGELRDLVEERQIRVVPIP
jgi:RHS repeat-associated protein